MVSGIFYLDIQVVEFIIRLVPIPHTVVFLHRPTTIANNSQPAFPLQFYLPYFIDESRSDDPLLLSVSHIMRMFLHTQKLMYSSGNFMPNIYSKFSQRVWIAHIYFFLSEYSTNKSYKDLNWVTVEATVPNL
jgi:hypothetical protein